MTVTVKRKRPRAGTCSYTYMALEDEPMYLALENGKVLALEKQPRHVVIEVPVFRTRPVRKYVVVDLTADDIPEIN